MTGLNTSASAGAPPGGWDTLARNKAARIERARSLADGKVVATEQAVALFEAVLEPGDKVCIEGDNQKFICVFQIGLEDDEEFRLVTWLVWRGLQDLFF